MTFTTTSSAELMENYLQADILEPQDKFTALQTDAGASLLFSIDSDGALMVTKELNADRHGWSIADLGRAQIARDFPNGATCKEFAAAQRVSQPSQAAEIHLAMVLNDGANDHLYVSLGNSDADTGWTDDPAWTACPFNASDGAGRPIPPPSLLRIVGVLISEASEGEFVVVDVVRNPSEPVGLVARYYLDLSDPANPVWKPHDIPIDLEVGGYSTCLGRASRVRGVDGLCTMGKVANAGQLIYTPIWNVFEPSQPAPSSALGLPGGLTPEAIAAARNEDDTSDLYVVSGEGLYYFASSNQSDGSTGVPLLSHPLLRGVRDLFASADSGGVTVWGLNGSDEVFYLAWAEGQSPEAGASNTPIVILDAVDAISPYVDRQYSANTFFAHGGGELIKAVKSPDTGLWAKQNITLPPSEAQQEAIAFSSYTTRIQVTDSNGQVAPNLTVSLSAASVTSVYINHLYYIVGPTPIEVKTDSFGAVTIVEAVRTLAATRFTATVGEQSLDVNPMDAPFRRSSELDSVASLQGAAITDKQGDTRPFIPAGASSEDLQGVAESNQKLATAYASLAAKPQARLETRAAPPAPSALLAEGFGDGIETDLGDLFSWLESGIEAIVSIVEDAAEGVWHFVAKIAGEVYHGILDCVEKVVAAALWVYNAVKVAIEDIIAFLEFLFAWQDILVTHRVMKNVLMQFAQKTIDDLSESKADLASLFTQLRADIDKWAGIPGFDQTPAGVVTSNGPLPAQNSAPSHLGIHHFQGNAGNSAATVAPADPAEAIFADLLALLANEEGTLTAAYEAIKDDVIAKFNELTVTQLIEKLLAIVADTMLDAAEAILLAVLDVLIQLVEGMMDVLTATIDIPVLSTLYKLVSGDDLSILDAICLIAAIPATLVYKAVAGETPFPRGHAFTEGLLDAGSFDDVKSQFYVPASAPALAATSAAVETVDDSPPVLDEARLKVFGLVAGAFAFVGSIALAIVSTLQKTFEALNIGIARPKTLAAIGAVANVAYVSPNIATLINAKTDFWYGQLNNVLTGVSIVKGFVAIPLATTENAAIKWMFPGVETTINVIWNVPVIANIVVNKDAWNTTYKWLIPESIGNFAFNVGGILELPIALVKDPEVKLGLTAGQDLLMVGYGCLMLVSGGIAEGT